MQNLKTVEQRNDAVAFYCRKFDTMSTHSFKDSVNYDLWLSELAVICSGNYDSLETWEQAKIEIYKLKLAECREYKRVNSAIARCLEVLATMAYSNNSVANRSRWNLALARLETLNRSNYPFDFDNVLLTSALGAYHSTYNELQGVEL